MRRKLLLSVLALGAIAGYSSAFFCHYGYRHAGHREAFEEHVADICVAAAQRRAASERGEH